MKIVHVVRQYLPSVGGLEEVVRSLAQQQLRQGRYRPSVLTLNRVFRSDGARLPASETLDGVPVQRLGYFGSERYALCPQAAFSLRGADLIHVHGIDFFFDYLALLHPAMQTPLVVSTHGGFFHTRFAGALKPLYFRSITRLSAMAYRRVIATSENDGAMFAPVVHPAHLQVIENGVDLDKFDDASAPALGPTLLYFGRWSVNKGLLRSMEVLCALCRQQPEVPWTLLIAGREYDLSASDLQRHACALGVADRVQLHPNPDVATLRALIGRASYFLCLSLHEGFGIAPIEAMSAGLIPLLSPIPPFLRLLQTTHAGVALDAATPEQQAQQITRLHEQVAGSGLRLASRRTAIRQSVQCYSWEGVARRYAQQYDIAMGLP